MSNRPRFRFHGNKDMAQKFYMEAWKYLDKMKWITPGLSQKGPFRQRFSSGVEYVVQEVFGQAVIDIFVPYKEAPVEVVAQEAKGKEAIERSAWIAIRLFRSDGPVITPASFGATRTSKVTCHGYSTNVYEFSKYDAPSFTLYRTDNIQSQVSEEGGIWSKSNYDYIIEYNEGETDQIINDLRLCNELETFVAYNPDDQSWYIYPESIIYDGGYNLVISGLENLEEKHCKTTAFAPEGKNYNKRWYGSETFEGDSDYPSLNYKEQAIHIFSKYHVFAPIEADAYWTNLQKFHFNIDGECQVKFDDTSVERKAVVTKRLEEHITYGDLDNYYDYWLKCSYQTAVFPYAGTEGYCDDIEADCFYHAPFADYKPEDFGDNAIYEEHPELDLHPDSEAGRYITCLENNSLETKKKDGPVDPKWKLIYDGRVISQEDDPIIRRLFIVKGLSASGDRDTTVAEIHVPVGGRDYIQIVNETEFQSDDAAFLYLVVNKRDPPTAPRFLDFVYSVNLYVPNGALLS